MAEGGSIAIETSSPLSEQYWINFLDGGPKSAELMGNTIGAGLVCRTDNACIYDPNNGAAAPGKLATFVGQSASGTWKLCIGDSNAGNTGTLQFARLIVRQ